MPTVVTVRVGANNWVRTAHRAIDRKQRVKLVLTGPDALSLAEALRRSRRPGGRNARIAGVDDIAIVAAIAVTVIAVLGLGTLAAVCLYGINQGYNIRATHRTRGPMPFDDQLDLSLVPPA